MSIILIMIKADNRTTVDQRWRRHTALIPFCVCQLVHHQGSSGGIGCALSQGALCTSGAPCPLGHPACGADADVR